MRVYALVTVKKIRPHLERYLKRGLKVETGEIIDGV